jgi:hypothetical protein
MAQGFNPEPSSIQISRMLRRPPRVGVGFNPMVHMPRPPALRRADGGAIPDDPMMPHVGPINTTTLGRADQDPMHVPPGSYVLPADIVSHIGEGNTGAGMKILAQMFLPLRQNAAGPLGMMARGAPSTAPYGAMSPKLPMGPGVGIPKGIQPHIGGLPSFTVAAGPRGQTSPVFHQEAHGGVVPGEPGGQFLNRVGVQQPGTPINASGGEFVIPPEEVKRRGRGDISRGHEMLDAWVRHVRAEHIQTLKKLPGPAK